MDIQKHVSSSQLSNIHLLDSIIIKEPFDTRILKQEVARCDWKSEYQHISPYVFNDWIKHHNINLLFTTISFESLSSFESHINTHQLISSKIVYEYSSALNIKSSEFIFSDTPEYDENNSYWVEMVRDLSLTSHYAKDYFIGGSGAFALYREWVKNTFSGYADKIFSVYVKDIPMGFVSLKNKSDGMYIDLIAVHREFRGRGLGQALIQKAIDYAYQHDKKLFVVTQIENIAANRLYQKMGFLSQSVALLYHKHWKE